MMPTHPFMSPIVPNVADLTEEQRELAKKRTAAVLRELDEIRRSLDLSIDQLPIVIEFYNKSVAAIFAEADRAEMAKRTSRLPITMRSEDRNCTPMKIKPGKDIEGKYFNVVTRPQCVAFRPEDFAIHGDRSRWMVHDIKVGNRSQFAAKRGPAPGTAFGPGGILERLRLETVQTAMDLVLVVEYIGPEPDGEVFEATIVGTAVE